MFSTMTLRATSVTQTPWLPILRPNSEARLRLFCFPYAGGSALIYRKWPDWVLPGVEVYPVQPPGRGGRLQETPFTEIEPLVEALAPVIAPFLDKPFAFFGHSMGASIGFELARLLRRDYGKEPLHFFVSARRAPQVPNTDPPIHDLPDELLKNELRRLEGTPAEVLEHPELMEVMLPLLRADFSVSEKYMFVPDAPLSCPLSALGGLQDSHVKREDLEAWRQLTTGPFLLRMFAGNHFFLHTAQNLLLRAVNLELHELLKILP